ncbi:MAG: putative lipid II flippase MurJ [Herpetosiphonaceae bacterium]|nr:MAG: putative lipid II flippase MurJ [Herpetosiphonaceae bacterium]
MSSKDVEAQQSQRAGRSVALAALLIVAGNLLSRVLALGRDQVIAARFGTGADLSLYTILSAIPTQIYDMLVGGLVSAALIPVFSEYAEEDHAEFWRIVSTIISIVLLALSLVGAVVWLFPELFALLLAEQLLLANPWLGAEAILSLRLMVIAVILMGLKGLAEAVLQSQRRFLLPAMATSLFNLGIIVAALAFTRLGITALALGMVLGAAMQVLVQLPGLEVRRLRPQLNLRHPAVRRIGLLYLPVAIGMTFSLLGITIDRNLASRVGPSAAAIMRYATVLIQFTLGLTSAAVGLAILPTLSRLSSDADEAGFRRMFAMGLKVVLMLVVPTMALMGALAVPLIRLLFERGEFTTGDTIATALALLVYLPGLLAAAVDQLLIFAFYARKSTFLPNLVQGIAVSSYLVVALLSYRVLGVYGLILANVLQHTAHMAVMLWIGQRRLGLIRGQRIGEAAWKIGLAGTAAGGLAFAGSWLIEHLVAGADLSTLLQLFVAGGTGMLVYILLLYVFKLEALEFFRDMLLRRLLRREVPSERGTISL